MNSPLLVGLGREIRRRRTRRGLTPTALAGQLSVSSSLIERIEAGEVNPSVRLLSDIAAALDVKVSKLLRDAEESTDS